MRRWGLTPFFLLFYFFLFPPLPLPLPFAGQGHQGPRVPEQHELRVAARCWQRGRQEVWEWPQISPGSQSSQRGDALRCNLTAT